VVRNVPNIGGKKWSKGGAKKRNTLRLDTSGFEELIVKLEGLEGDVKGAVTDALLQAAETVKDDTVDALSPQYMPRQGVYSSGQTKTTVVDAEVKWSGTIAEAPVGFDYGEKGAGGFLISGTPRMQPNRQLEQIYTRKKYMKKLQQDMQAVVTDYIRRTMEG
jgi:hypothetical protein